MIFVCYLRTLVQSLSSVKSALGQAPCYVKTSGTWLRALWKIPNESLNHVLDPLSGKTLPLEHTGDLGATSTLFWKSPQPPNIHRSTAGAACAGTNSGIMTEDIIPLPQKSVEDFPLNVIGNGLGPYNAMSYTFNRKNRNNNKTKQFSCNIFVILTSPLQCHFCLFFVLLLISLLVFCFNFF